METYNHTFLVQPHTHNESSYTPKHCHQPVTTNNNVGFTILPKGTSTHGANQPSEIPTRGQPFYLYTTDAIS